MLNDAQNDATIAVKFAESDAVNVRPIVEIDEVTAQIAEIEAGTAQIVEPAAQIAVTVVNVWIAEHAAIMAAVNTATHAKVSAALRGAQIVNKIVVLNDALTIGKTAAWRDAAQTGSRTVKFAGMPIIMAIVRPTAIHGATPAIATISLAAFIIRARATIGPIIAVQAMRG